MPTAMYWFAALLLGVAVVTLLLLNTVGIRRIRRDLDARARSDAVVEEQVRRWADGQPDDGEGPDKPPPPRRHLRLMPLFAGMSGLGVWAKAHQAPALASVAAAGAMGLAALVPTPAGGEARPRPVPPTPSVEVTRVVPPVVSTATAHLPPVRPAAPRPASARPVPSRTSTAAPTALLPTATRTVPTAPTSTPSTTGSEPCLLGVGLLGVDVCVPPLR